MSAPRKVVRKIVRKTVEVPKHYEQIDELSVFDAPLTTGLIADIFKVLYGNRFIYSCGVLYNYNDTYWKPDDAKLSGLSTFVDKQFLKDLNSYVVYAKGKEEIEPKNKYDKFMGKLSIDLRNYRTRNAYVSDINLLLTKNDIKWNVNPYYFAFENVIYDLRTGNTVSPNPEDYINTTTGYAYDFNYDLKKVDEITLVLNQILPDQNVREYVYKALSTSLSGLQIAEIFIFFGVGGNGKSVIIRLLQKMLGNYGYEIPAVMLSKPLQDGGNPQASNMANKRLLLGSEPDKNSTLCSSTAKALTGNPTINARANHSNHCEVPLVGTLLIDANGKPKLDEVIQATSRRLENSVVPFLSLFTTKDKYNTLLKLNNGVIPPNVFIGNSEYMEEHFRETYKQALFIILLPFFQKYVKDKFNDCPQLIKDAGKEYMTSSDDIFDWFSGEYEEDPDEMVYVNDIHEKFLRFAWNLDMTKEERRKTLTVSHFKTTLKNNHFLSMCYKEAGISWKKVQHKKPFLAGWKIRSSETVEDTPEKTT